MSIVQATKTKIHKTLIETESSGAVFSDCEQYRYILWRKWSLAEAGRYAMLIGLNPSTADESINDPTVRRCIDFAKKWGMDGMYMMNAYAFRATDPAVMKKQPTPVGWHNDEALALVAKQCEIIVAAWGNHCTEDRSKKVIEIVESVGKTIQCFELNQNGSPKHPLYVKGDTVLKTFGVSSDTVSHGKG